MRKLKLLATERLFKMDAITGRRGIQAGIRFIVRKGLDLFLNSGCMATKEDWVVLLLLCFLQKAISQARRRIPLTCS